MSLKYDDLDLIGLLLLKKSLNSGHAKVRNQNKRWTHKRRTVQTQDVQNVGPGQTSDWYK